MGGVTVTSPICWPITILKARDQFHSRRHLEFPVYRKIPIFGLVGGAVGGEWVGGAVGGE